MRLSDRRRSDGTWLDEESGRMRQVTVSIEEWIRLVESGVSTPARVTPRGNSMWPLIRDGRDTLEVRPISRDEDAREQIKVGDIIIFRRVDRVYVVHRVWKIGKEDIQTFGDNCQKPDEPISIEDVCGVVTKIYRNGDKVIDPGSRSAMALGMIKHRIAEMKQYVKEEVAIKK